MGLQLITPATALPVAIADLRAYCGIEDDSRDGLLAKLAKGATARVQNIVDRSLAAEGWRLTLDRFSDAIELSRGPVVAVAGVTYADADGAPQTLDPAVYTLDLVSNPQWLVLNADEAWPETLDAVNAVSIDFTAGYDADSLPGDLALAVMMLTAHYFENRGVVNVGSSVSDLPEAVKAITDPYRRIVI